MSRAVPGRCGARRSVFAGAAVVHTVCAKSLCVQASGHDGPHHDGAGGAWWVTPEIADAVTVSFLAHTLAGAFGRPTGEEP